MTHSSSPGRAGARGLAVAAAALALFQGLPAKAQTSAYPQVRGPDGTNQPPAAATLLGLDAVTGAACLVGASATCQLPGQVATAPSSLGGASSFAASGGTGAALLTASPVQIGPGGPHSFYHWHCANGVASTVWLQIFDAAAGAVTLGATPPKLSYPIPASGYWEEHYAGEERPAFANAITVAVTTTPTGSTAPATGAACNFIYK
jgi:hypothetical protein